MGHAAHFLQRLDRVSDGQVELALTLYRDHDLLREVLSRASLPDDAERVAISLDDPIEGPFVVVTREGRFVTCLGAGMLVSDLPIVTRERLDAAAARVERMREELGRVRALRDSGADGQAGLAFKRMQQQGPRFAREDAETLLRVQPLIEAHCLRQIAELIPLLLEEAVPLARLRLETPQRLSKLDQRLILAFGDAVWGLAHMLVVVGSSAVRSTMERTDQTSGRRDSLMEAMARMTFEWGTFTHVMRSLWFVARGGKRALASVKGLELRAYDVHQRVYRELALTSIALGSDKLRAEAQKALSAREHLPLDDESVHPLDRASALFAVEGHRVLAAPAASEATFLAASRQWAAGRLCGDRDPTAEEQDAIPEDVARIAYFATQFSIHDHQLLQPLTVAMQGLPWVVRAEPAELFLPAEWAQRLLWKRSVGDVLNWFVPYAKARGLLTQRGAPHRAAATPGRNAPCPCGSGKKHKRCCGA